MADPIQLPGLMTERDAAERLGVHVETLRRERKLGRIGHVLIGKRPRYTSTHIHAYITASEVQPWREGPPTNPAESAPSGYPSGRTAPSGAGHGTTGEAGKRAANRLARRILSKPTSRLPNG